MTLSKITVPGDELCELKLPLFSSHVSAGFPSPADDFIDCSLDLNEFLVKHPSSTFFAWAQGESLSGLGINNGDLLIIDRSLEYRQGMIVVAAIDGELTCKVLDLKQKRLLSANPAYPSIDIGEDADMLIEGVVVYSVKNHSDP